MREIPLTVIKELEEDLRRERRRTRILNIFLAVLALGNFAGIVSRFM